ncbi:MAG: DUF58 domain-containing protein [Anaerolineae bacterium]
MINRLLLLGILIYAIVVLGMAALNGAVLALAIPLLVFLGAGLLYGPETPQFHITRSLSTDRAEPSAPVSVTLSITNEGNRIDLAHIVDNPPRQLEVVEGHTELLTALDPGETVELTYTLRGQRGRYDFDEVKIRVMDFLGLLRRDVSVPVPGQFEFFVYPEVRRVDRIPIRPRVTKAYAGHIPSRVSGSGVDFFGVRHYQQGDSLRHINWRANARHQGTFYSNEFEQERVADVGIILDARQRTYVQIGDQSLFEHAIAAAATLADSFLTDGNRVALLRYGDLLDWTVPGYGKFQRERILQALARAQMGDSLIFDRLEHLPTRLFPPKSQIVMVSPLASDDADLLPRLRARGYQVLIISPNPIAFEKALLERNELTAMAERIATVERELLFRKLRQAGIQVFDWHVDIPLNQALAASMAQLRPLLDRNIGIVTS